MITSIPIRIALFYAAVFLVIGVHVPFWPVWLKSRGLGPAEIGLILSISTWIRALAPAHGSAHHTHLARLFPLSTR